MPGSEEFTENGVVIMNNTYESPLSARYADAEMKFLFSPDKKFMDLAPLMDCVGSGGKRAGASN